VSNRGKRDRLCEESNAGSNIELTVKLNTELNAELNAHVRAQGIRKCHSYGVGCDATTIQVTIKTTTATATTRTLVCEPRDCGDSWSI
jgi:hypothetical protein